MYDELATERAIKSRFGINIDIRQMILCRAPVSHTSEAMLFMTDKKQLFLYITGKSKLVLNDIKKIVSHMGLKAELYVPPKGRPNYFNEIGTEKFHEVFPGRKNITDQDIAFYRLLTPYNPALVLISETKNGIIYQFDNDATTKWRPSIKFTYRRIKTS